MRARITDRDFFTQSYLEELMHQRYTSLKLNNVIPWTDHSSFDADVNPLPVSDRTGYFGYLYAPGEDIQITTLEGVKLKVANDFDKAYPLLFAGISSAADDYGDIRFIGWKISFDNELANPVIPPAPEAPVFVQGFMVFLYEEKDMYIPSGGLVADSDFGFYWMVGPETPAELKVISAKDAKSGIAVYLASGGAGYHADNLKFDFASIDHTKGLYYECIKQDNRAVIDSGFAGIGSVPLKVVGRSVVDGKVIVEFGKTDIPGIDFRLSNGAEVVDLTDKDNPIKIGDLVPAGLSGVDVVRNAGQDYAVFSGEDGTFSEVFVGQTEIRLPMGDNGDQDFGGGEIGNRYLGKFIIEGAQIARVPRVLELGLSNMVLYMSDANNVEGLSGSDYELFIVPLNEEDPMSPTAPEVAVYLRLKSGGFDQIPYDFVRFTEVVFLFDNLIPVVGLKFVADNEYMHGAEEIGYRYKIDFDMYGSYGMTLQNWLYSRNNPPLL